MSDQIQQKETNLKKKFTNNNIVIVDETKFNNELRYKSYDRYSEFFSKFNRNHLEISLEELIEVYKKDVRLRRSFLKIIFFLEVEVKSTLLNAFHDSGVVFGKKMSQNERNYFIFSESPEKDKEFEVQARDYDKFRGKDASNTPTKAEKFIQKIASQKTLNLMRYLLSDKYLLFGAQKWTKEDYGNFELIRKLRNDSAHNDLLFSIYSTAELLNLAEKLKHYMPYEIIEEYSKQVSLINEIDEFFVKHR